MSAQSLQHYPTEQALVQLAERVLADAGAERNSRAYQYELSELMANKSAEQMPELFDAAVRISEWLDDFDIRRKDTHYGKSQRQFLEDFCKQHKDLQNTRLYGENHVLAAHNEQLIHDFVAWSNKLSERLREGVVVETEVSFMHETKAAWVNFRDAETLAHIMVWDTPQYEIEISDIDDNTGPPLLYEYGEKIEASQFNQVFGPVLRKYLRS